jgi:hypothetical protein
MEDGKKKTKKVETTTENIITTIENPLEEKSDFFTSIVS